MHHRDTVKLSRCSQPSPVKHTCVSGYQPLHHTRAYNAYILLQIFNLELSFTRTYACTYAHINIRHSTMQLIMYFCCQCIHYQFPHRQRGHGQCSTVTWLHVRVRPFDCRIYVYMPPYTLAEVHVCMPSTHVSTDLCIYTHVQFKH